MINFVYVTTNLINGKQYVGDHSTQNVNDTYFGSGRIFLKALKKYGKENFTREILKIYNTRLEAYIAQEYYINLYNTLYPLGYNISPKGGHEVKGSVSEFTKEKISLKQKGISKRLYFIKKFGEDGEKKYLEYLQKTKNRKPLNCKGKGIKNRMIEKYGEIIGIKKYNEFIQKQKTSHQGKSYTKGRKVSEETRLKMVNSHIGLTQSKETIEKRAKTHRGRKNTQETKDKMSLAAKDKPKEYDVWNKNKTFLNITSEIIFEIKQMKEIKLQREIAEMYNLSVSCVARIVNGFYDAKVR